MDSEKPLNPPCPAWESVPSGAFIRLCVMAHVRGRSVFAMPALQRALWQMCCDGKAMRDPERRLIAVPRV